MGAPGREPASARSHCTAPYLIAFRRRFRVSLLPRSQQLFGNRNDDPQSDPCL